MDAEAQSSNRIVKQAVVKQAVVTQTPEAKETEQQSLVKRQLNAIYSRFGRSKKSPIKQTAGEEVQAEPRRLNAQPATRAAIKHSKPASSRRLFPSLFPRKPAKKPAPVKPSTATNINDRLRELYERDGREVPAYMLEDPSSFVQSDKFQLVPPAKPQSANLAKSAKPMPKAKVEMPAAPAPEARPGGEIRQVSNNPFKRFFSKLNPLRRSSKPKPKSEKPDRVEPLPQAAREERQRLEQGLIPPAPISPASNPVILPRKIEQPAVELPAFDPELPDFDPPKAPALLPDESDLEPGGLPDFKPDANLNNVEEIKGLDNKKENPIEEIGIPSLTPEISDLPITDEKPELPADQSDALDNPFPELPEEKVDAAQKENPFTGLTLDTKDGSGSIAAELPSLPKQELPLLPEQPVLPIQPAALPELPSIPQAPLLTEEPAVIGQPALPELPSITDNNSIKDSELPALDGKLPEIKPEEAKPEGDSKKQDHSDKLQKIAERKELTGLKGFCPVDLRDNRGLTDSLPQFNSEFEGVTYNFSSLEAKQKFDKSPAKYAPASGGQDVVKNDELEAAGSLDHAVWYKDRLYLFATQESLQTFVIDPAKFAISK
jgi:YHS domain-containing protein